MILTAAGTLFSSINFLLSPCAEQRNKASTLSNESSEVKTRSVSSFGSNLVSYIGRSSYNDIFYKGGVMDVRVYNRTLSNDEINDLYETTAPPEVVKQANLNYSGSDKKEAYLIAYFKGESLANGEQIYYATSETD